MKKLLLPVCALLLSACSNFADDGDFSDAIANVRERTNFIEVRGKSFSTSDIIQSNTNILKTDANITGIFPRTDKPVASSYVMMEVSYFKSYTEFDQATYDGKTVPLKAYQVSTSMCTDTCSATQYVTFPVDNVSLEKAAQSGLAFTITTPNDTAKVDYLIPAGYVQAILDERDNYAGMAAAKATTTIATAVVASDPVVSQAQQMTEYWYAQASDEQQQAFSSWAFNNRKTVSGMPEGDGKPLEMLDYWYKQASEQERAQILTWLLKQ